MKKQTFFSLIVFFMGIFGFADLTVVGAESIYVDRNLSSNCLGSYNPSSKSCSGGSDIAYRNISGAAGAADPGDTILIRGGTYNERLIPKRSGTGSNYITYKNYNNEVVTITGTSEAAIYLDNVDYIVIEGLWINNVVGWLRSVDSNHNIIRNNEFTRATASGTTGGLKIIRSDDNKLLNNTIQDGNDNLLFIDSDRNLVEGNSITEARHTVWGIKCGNYNVVRNNYFYNRDQKIGEIFDCDSGEQSDTPDKFDATKYNLVENNIFAHGVKYYSTSGGNGIQYSAQNGIIRNNVFYEMNAGLGMQVYSKEAERNKYNRIYNNVFHKNECGGIAVRGGSSTQVRDNIFKNNVLFDNTGCEGSGRGQILYRTPLAESIFENNNILGTSPGQNVIQEEFGSGGTLASYESRYPSLFIDNMEVVPMFVDASGRDYHLREGSPLIDTGTFLTKTAASGSGKTLVLEDAGYFYDGFDIQGERPDTIQLEGQAVTATIVDIDYNTNTLILETNLSWTKGQGVGLAYSGYAPDLGAFEYDTGTNPTPKPSRPKSLRIERP